MGGSFSLLMWTFPPNAPTPGLRVQLIPFQSLIFNMEDLGLCFQSPLYV